MYIYVCIIAIVITLTHFNTIQILLRNSVNESRARGSPELDISPWLYFLRARGECLNLRDEAHLIPRRGPHPEGDARDSLGQESNETKRGKGLPVKICRSAGISRPKVSHKSFKTPGRVPGITPRTAS